MCVFVRFILYFSQAICHRGEITIGQICSRNRQWRVSGKADQVPGVPLCQRASLTRFVSVNNDSVVNMGIAWLSSVC